MGPYKNSSSVATLSATAEMDDPRRCSDGPRLRFDADSHNVSRQNATKKKPKKQMEEVDKQVEPPVDSASDDRPRRSCPTMTTILTRLLPVTCLAVALCVAVVRRAGGSDVTNALIVIDVQNCFTSGGTLAVAGGDDVIPVINGLRSDYGPHFDVVVLTQDWHCVDHVSFASQHPGHSVYEQVELTYLNNSGELCSSPDFNKSYTVDCSSSTSATTNLTQVLWPDHCIINSTDAELKSNLTRQQSDIIIYKGYHCQIDSYSAFYDNGHMAQTELQTILKKRGVTTVYVVGLATDYCVFYSAKDALSLDYTTYVVLDATRGVDPNTTSAAVADMKRLGIHVINSTDIAGTFPASGVTRPNGEIWKSNPALALAVVVQFYGKEFL